ncbi:hypothetical protein AGMMS49965_16860 [Bacteroidia bacterium]|nr:hypothetical protein AGMMS49965_16860 [Bacteroidia bacterium]
MRKKKFFGFCVAATVLLGTGVANAETGSWTSGGTTVVLTDDGVLSVSGTGAMANYPKDEDPPWSASRDAIKTLTINEGVTSIGDGTFIDYSGLTAVTIPDGVTSIGEAAFYGCSGLTAVTIPNGVTSIGEQAFYKCSGLTSVTIPNSVTSIGERAFASCSGLTAINVDAANTQYSQYSSVDGVLYNRNQNTLVVCPAGKSGTFTIPNSVTSIGETAFYGCSGLTSVTIPFGVTSIGEQAFARCDGLTGALTIPNSVTSIGNAAFADCGLTSVDISNSVTSIGERAFSGCDGLTSVTIPDGVTSIGGQAFYYCSGLTSVTIPNSVTSIEYMAFDGCGGLTSVFCHATMPPTLSSDNFTAVSADRLYVPESASDAYNNSDWKSAFDIILAIESATSVSLDKTSAALSVGDTEQLTASILPTGASVTAVTWSSSNTEVATVSASGEVTAVSAGTATITVTTADGGFTEDCIVTVTASGTAVKTVDGDKLHVYPNPTTGVVFVDNANGAEIKVYNLNGALLHRTRESRVDLSGEPSGVYLLRVGGATLKVVKK